MQLITALLTFLLGERAVNHDASGTGSIDFSKVFSASPGLKHLHQTTHTHVSVNSVSIASSIVSVLNKQHEATMSHGTVTKHSSSSTHSATSRKTSSSTPSSHHSSSKSSSRKSSSIRSSTVHHKRAATSTSTTSSQVCTASSSIYYGYQPAVPNNGTTFLLDTTMAAISSSNIWPPAGYWTAFTGLYAGLFAQKYMGYYQLSSYNTSMCAAICNQFDACLGFNIYFERTPVYIPDSKCRNPTAQAAVTCALWGSEVDSSTALNIGQYKIDFMVVIQGSNGYNAYPSPSLINNYTQIPVAGSLNPDTSSYYLTYQYFTTYDNTLCAAACNAYTASARVAAISFKKTTYTACNFFTTFIPVASNGANGMYCQLWSSSKAQWGSSIYQTTQSGVTFNLTNGWGYYLYPQDTGSTSISWTPAPTGTAAACSNLGINITDYNQVLYTVACGYDVQYSNDIGNATAPDFYACFNLCDNFSGCNAFAYLGTTCYFKNMANSNRTPQPNSWVDFAWQPTAYAGFQASTIASTVSKMTTITKAWTGTSTTTVTSIAGLSGSVVVLTPGPVGNTIWTATDSGTATAMSVSTILSGSTTTYMTVWPTPSACGSSGIRWAMYSNLAAGYQATNNYPAFTPEAYKKLTPTKTGTALYLAETNAQSSTTTVYGAVQTFDTTTIDHVFYVYAGRGTGYYTFQIPYADDAEFVWIGANALSGWSRANFQLFYSWYGPTQTPYISYFLTGGTYTPVRILWGNGGGPGNMQFLIWAPDGTLMITSYANTNTGYLSAHIVQAPCNSSLGAPFPAWGKET